MVLTVYTSIGEVKFDQVKLTYMYFSAQINTPARKNKTFCHSQELPTRTKFSRGFLVL